MVSNTAPHPSGRGRIPPPQEADTTYSTPVFRPSMRRTPSSFSSSSSSSPSHSHNSSFGSLSFNEEYLFSPRTPLRYSGVPFSWEQLPGIPKNLGSTKKKQLESSRSLLPLPPPAGNSTHSSKKYAAARRDPFFAAFVECSKDEDDSNGHDEFWKLGSNKITRSLSDRFGFINMNTSCKNTCTVSESIVYLPRSTRPHYLLNPRSKLR